MSRVIQALPLLLALVAVSAPEVSAQSLIDRMKAGAEKAAEKAEDNVRSTVDLVTDEPTVEATRAELDAMADATLERLFQKKPEAEALFERSAAYAVFDTRNLSLGVKAGYGRGVAFSRVDDAHYYMKMGIGGVGVSIGFGGFESQLVIFFEDATLFEEFVRNGYDGTAEAGTMFGDAKADYGVRFVDGRSIFVLTKKGWKVAVSAAGTKYWQDSALN